MEGRAVGMGAELMGSGPLVTVSAAALVTL